MNRAPEGARGHSVSPLVTRSRQTSSRSSKARLEAIALWGFRERTRAVLVMSDRDARRKLTEHLQAGGVIDVLTDVGDAHLGVAEARRLGRGAVIIDGGLLKRFGGELIQEIKAVNPACRVLVMASSESARDRALRNGADQAILKPRGLKKLAFGIGVTLGRRPVSQNAARPRILERVPLAQSAALLGMGALLLLLTPYSGVQALGDRLAVLSLTAGGVFFLYALKYYASVALILLTNPANGNGNGNGHTNGNGNGKTNGINGLSNPNGQKHQHDYQPFISIHLPVYNEPAVIDRLISACTSFDYDRYEVIVADDSQDETSRILDQRWAAHPRLKISRRKARVGFKGAALQLALQRTDPRAEFIVVFDADFIPPPDILQQFLTYFYGTNGVEHHSPNEPPRLIDDRLAAVQGYQWHVLNASENWITRGVRTEYSGSYVIERSGQQIVGSMRMIAGSVFMIRADVMRQLGWGTSITEDWDLTLRLYETGYKVVYTPFVQAPAECVASLRQLAKQRMRWAEGHTYNIKKHLTSVLLSPHISWPEKLEFLYYAPYYLQSALFIVGTLSWLIVDLFLRKRFPFWPTALGWSLVFTNALSLIIMNLVGLFMERGVRRNAGGLMSFILLTYLLVPFQAYAAIKGLFETHEGGWHRTQKTGVITDAIERLGLRRKMHGLLPKKSKKKEGLDIGRRLGLPVARLVQRLPAPVQRLAARRQLGLRLASGLALAIIVIILLAGGVPFVSAAPDAFYLHDSSLNDGKMMNLTTGAGGAAITFDAPSQSAVWYTDLTYPTGTDDAGIAAGDYSLDLYFDQLPTLSSDWYKSDWLHRKPITIDHTKVGSGGVSNFPVLINLSSDSELAASACNSPSAGYDILFTSSNGTTKLSHEIETFNDSTGALVAWVKVPSLSSSSDTTIYMYYGNSTCSDQQDVANVWSSYVGVWHMKESSGSGYYVRNSAQNRYHANAGSTQYLSSSIIDGGRDFNSSYLTVQYGTELFEGDTSFTLELWGYPDYASDSAWSSAGEDAFLDTSTLWGCRWRQSGTGTGWLQCDVNWTSGTDYPYCWDVLNRRQWNHMVLTYNGTYLRWYVNGAECSSITNAGRTLATNSAVYFGGATGMPINSNFDEYRYARSGMTAAWILTEYNNQGSPSTFFQPLGSEEGQSSVDITVTVSHTDPDGSSPATIGTTSTTINSETPNPLTLDLGTAAAQTFTAADPQRLRVQIVVDSVMSSGSFDLSFDSSGEPTRLETPAVVAPENSLGLLLVAALIPLLTAGLTSGRRFGVRVVSVVGALVVALGLLARQVGVVSAAPDAFFLHTDALNGGEMMNISQGGGSATKIFDTASQTAEWSTELVYPTGQDDATIAAGDYSMHLYFDQLPDPWWDTDYAYREQITVSATDAVEAGYSVSLTFDHASLVNASKALASGQDVRVVYHDGSSYTELDRAIDPLSAWDDANTQIWFALVDPISASGSDDNYFLYYGNSAAGAAPADWANVFMIGDDFNDGTLTAGVDTSTAGTSSISEAGGEASIDLGANEATDAGIIVGSGPLPSDNRFVIRHKTELLSGGGVSDPEVKNIGIQESLGQATVDTSANENPRRRIIDFARVDTNAEIYYFDSPGSANHWDGSAWQTGNGFWGTLSLDTYYIHELISDGTDWYVRVSDANGTVLTTTTPIAWSNTYDTGDPLWFYWGEIYTDYYYADQQSDWVYVRDYVASEPGAVLGSEEDAPYVDITVGVQHTAVDGSDAEPIVSVSTRIDANTSNPFDLSLGSGTQQTFTQSDPRRIEVMISVDQVNGGGSFDLAYDSAAEPTDLETPDLTVPEISLIFVLLALFIPILTFVLTEKRRRLMAVRLVSIAVAVILALGLMPKSVVPAFASPDAFYLHDTATSGINPAGKYANTDAGTGGSTLTFDTPSQSVYWYTDLSYPTGADDASIAAGAYSLNMYFSSLPGDTGWWNTDYLYRKQITVTAGSAAVPTAYSVSVQFDHQSLVSDGKSLSSGNDVRIAYWSGSAWVELDRVLDTSSAWNSLSTKIWFKTQAAINASASDNNYYVYYGNASAGSPPANAANVYLFSDDFEAGNLNKWTVENGLWQIATDQTRSGTYSLKYPTEANGRAYILADPALDEANVYVDAWWRISSTTSLDVSQLVRRNVSANSHYETDLESTTGWDIAKVIGGTWSELSPNVISPTINTWTRIGTAIAGTGMRVFKDGAQINPASGAFNVGSELSSGNVGLKKYNPGTNWWIDDVVARKYVDPEPTGSLGSEAGRPAVNITVSVYHTDPDGSNPQLIASSSSTQIDAGTANPLVLSLGSGSQQTITSADSQRLRVLITVDSVTSGGSFVLDYDSGTSPTTLETPNLTVPDISLPFLALAVLIPLLTAALTMNRKTAVRLVSLLVSLIVALGLLASQVGTVTAAPDVFYMHDTSTATSIAHQETQTTAQTTASSYGLPLVGGGSDQLYLVSVAIYQNNITVSSIDGGGLSWTLQKRQCSARITQPRVEIWQAFGSPSSFAATVNLSGSPLRSSATISRYAGADPTSPTEAAAGSNTNGLNGTCGGGTDGANASLSLTSTRDNSVLYVATHPRNRLISTPDSDYAQRAFINNENSGDGANLYLHDRELASAGTDAADHVLSGVTDWDMAGLVIRPRTNVTPAGKIMNTTLGSGAAALTFDTPTQSASWYTDLSYPTGDDDASIAAGDYTLNMYFDSLPSGPGNWYDTDWSYRKKLTIDASQVSADLTYYPVLVSLPSDAQLAANAQADGGDILFTTSDGTAKVDHEIERYDTGTGELVAWVELPTVSGSVDTDFYMYYGNASAPNQWNSSATWDSNYVGVWHLDESGAGARGEFSDSTGNSNDGTGGKGYSGYTPARTTGQIGYGQTFDGVNDFIDMANSGWANANWPYRKRIVIDGDQVSGTTDLNNFPVLISFSPNSDNDLKSTGNGGHVGKSDGTDIFFTNDEGVKIDHELEKYDPATGELIAWVEAPELYGNADTTIYMYYGYASAADQQSVAGTWSNGYQTVYHLHDDFADSTGNHSAATNNGSGNASGVAADGQSFNGSSQYIDTNFNSNYASTQNFTWEGWFKLNGVSGSDDILGIEDRGGGDNSEIRLAVRDDQAPSGEADSYDALIWPDGSGNYSATQTITNPDDGTWHYAVLLRDGTTGRLYYDGSQVNSGAVGSGAINFPVTLLIGAQWDTDASGQRNYFEGDLDEIRTSTTLRSPAWIATQFNNMHSPSTFYQVLSEEVPGDVTLDLTGAAITLEAWVRYDSSNPGPNGIMMKNGWADGYRLDLQTTRRVNFELSGDTSHVWSNGTLTASPAWHHVVATYDGSTMREYIDGQPDTATTARSGNIERAGKEFWIGHGDHAIEKAWSEPWDGELDEVRISTTARSAGWIETEYNNQLNQGAGAGKFIKTLAAAESAGSVDITVSVYHTDPDGSSPALITASTSTTIDSGTANPLALSLGSGSQQTYTAADPQLVRVLITVDSVSGGGSFTLAYDSTSEASNLETPSVSVPDFSLAFLVLAILIPLLTSTLTMRRRMAVRLLSVLGSLTVALGLLAGQVSTVTASPDAFYLHNNATSGINPAGRYMNTTLGSGASTLVFDTPGQNAYWYNDITYPTGSGDASIAAGAYALNMYFSQLPTTSAPAVDATSTGTANTGATGITISHTTSGSNRLMLVGVSINNDNLETVSSITYNSVALTYVGSINNSRSGGDDARVEIWRLVAPATGTHNVVITFSAALLQQAVAGVMTFTGVDQTTPLGTFASNENDPSPATVTVQSATNELVFGVVCTEYGAITTDPGQTERWNLGVASNTYGAGSTKAGASSVTLTWTIAGSPHWAAAGISIKPATPAVNITASVYHANADGSNPQLITSSSTTKIDAGTANPLALSLGSGSQQTFTAANPQRLRALITVNSVVNGGSFTLAYDSATNHSSLNTPTVTVPETSLVFLILVPMIPYLLAAIWRRRRLAGAVASGLVAASIAIGFLASQVATVTAAPDTFYLHDVFQEVQTGGSSSSTTVATSASLTGVTGHLYLAAISTRPGTVNVSSISGLGLTWTRVLQQCSGNTSQTLIDVWRAIGTPSGNGVVTATLSGTATNAVIAVTRYAGVNTSNPIGATTSANVNGVGGSCSGGTASSTPTVNLTTQYTDSYVYGAFAIQNRTFTPGIGYAERADLRQGASTIAGVAVEDRLVASPSTVAVNGTLSNTTQWAVVGIEIRRDGISPTGRIMNITQGSAGSTMAFNTAGQNAYWYVDQTWPTGSGNGGIAAGPYTLNMYFSSLPAAWYNASWSYRKKITIDYTKVSGDQTNFPVLISLPSDTELAANACNAPSAGYDILFTSSNGTSKLSHEIERFNDSTGELEAWVKVPALSSTSNTILYMYYGNGSCSNQQDVVNVWTGYVGVWHLSESSGSGYYIKNSAQNNYHANANSTTYLSSSIIDGGRDFNNSYSDVQNGSGLFGGNTAFALELWGYPDYATDADWYEESYLMSDSLNLCRWRHDSGAPAGRGTLQCDVHWTGGAVDYFTSVNDALTRQAWNHIVLTYDGANLKWYVNGSQNSQLSRASASLLANTYAMLGNNGGIDSNFDEYRYSSVVRSSGWILTEYNNQSSPSVFYAIGGQTTASSNVQIVVTVSHTAPDGSGATTIVTSSTTTINSSTANPYALSIGSGAQQTFTSGNPRRLRAQINVSAVNGSEGFVLAYDGSCASTQCSNLDTPVVTVPEPGLGLIGIAATLPGLAAAIRRRKKRRTLYRRVQAGGVS